MRKNTEAKMSLIYIESARGAEFFKGPGWYYIDETLDIVGPWKSRSQAHRMYFQIPRRES